MSNVREAGIIVIGSSAGVAQTFVLKQYVDPTAGNVVPQLGGFGKPSALAGLAGGGIATSLGILGVMGKGPVKNSDLQTGLIAYGVPALVGGVISGVEEQVAGAGLSLGTPIVRARTPIVRVRETPAMTVTGNAGRLITPSEPSIEETVRLPGTPTSLLVG